MNISSLKPRRRRRLGLEALEERWTPVAGDFASAFGLGISGVGTDLKANAVAEDAIGNVIVVGSLSGTANFDAKGGTTNLTSGGNRDSFVAKYGPTGSLLWAETFTGTTSSSVGQASAVQVDASGNIFVAGSFTGSVNFTGLGSVLANGVGVVTATNTNAYVIALNSSGQQIWMNSSFGTTGSVDEAYGLALDGSGGVDIAGSYQNSAIFGTTTLTATGSFDAFAAHLDSSGNFVWAKSTSGSGVSTAEMRSVTVDSNGRIVMGGFHAGTVDFDPGAGTTSLSSNGGSRDAAVWVLDSSGNLAWVRGFGGNDFDQANAVTVDKSGNIYATGSFSGTVAFATGGSFVKKMTASGIYDAYVIQLNSAGSLNWAANFAGSTGTGAGQGIVVDPLGRVVVDGWFQGTTNFNTGPSSALLTATGSEDVFVATLDSYGNYIFATRAGGSSGASDLAFGIAVNSTGTVQVVGSYTGSATFGTTNLAAVGRTNIFAAMISAPATPPPTPLAPRLEATSDTGASATDNITSVTSPTFDVSATSNSQTIELLRDGNVIGQRTGSGPVTDPGPVSDGIHTYTCVQINGVGVVSSPSSGLQVTILTATPATPTTPGLLASEDSGYLGDGITNNNQPHLVGLAVPLDTVQLLNGSGQVIATSQSTPTGTFSIQVPATLADNTYLYRVRVVDIAGNQSSPSATFSLRIDTTLPAAPSTLALLPADDTGAPGDNITNVNTPHLIGTAEPGATVELLSATGTILGTTLAASNGSFTVSANRSFADGQVTLQAVAIDVAGNVGPVNSSLTITIMTRTPATPIAPTILPADDSGAAGDGITNVARPRLVGTATAGLTVALLSSGGSILATSVVNSGGGYTLTPTNALPNGASRVTVVALDVAGNMSAASGALNLTILASPPSAPSRPALLASDDSGTLGDGITNVNRPNVIGTAPANLTITLFSNNVAIGTAATSTSGTYDVRPSIPFADGTYTITATATDLAGNVSISSSPFTLVIMTTIPTAPTTLKLANADDSGTLGDGITNVNMPHFTGTAQGQTTVQLISLGSIIGTTVAGSSGFFSVQPTSFLADGSYQLSFRAIDQAGNVGATSSALSITIKTSLPTVPTSPTLFINDDSGTVGDRLTNVNKPRLIGTADPYVSLKLLDGSGNILGTGNATSSGSYTLVPTNALPDGVNLLSVVATDSAGNVAANSPVLSLTILTKPPTQPSSINLFAADDSGALNDGITNVVQPRLIGTATPFASVTILDASANTLGLGIAGSDGSFRIKLNAPLNQGTYKLHARVTDAAANVSPDGSVFNLTVMTATPGTPSLSLSPASDTGAQGDNITVTRNPSLAGIAPAGATIQLFDNSGKLVTSAVASALTGAFTIQTTAATAGSFNYTVKAVDVAGNTSAASLVETFRILPTAGDFTGDLKADAVTYNPQTSVWTIRSSSTTQASTIQFGWAGVDIPMPADYDAVGRSEVAVYRPGSSDWFIINPVTGTTRHIQFGQNGDIPVPGDYDGVGKAELAVYRPSTAQWLIMNPVTNAVRTVTFGWAGVDQPMPGDYDGVGKVQIAVYRPFNNTFFVAHVNGNTTSTQVGNPRYLPIPADYDGDGKVDLATYNPATVTSTIVDSTNGKTVTVVAGQTGTDQPIPLDYDGVGKVNIANYRLTTATYYIRSNIDTSRAVISQGVANADQPVMEPLAFRLSGTKLLPVSQNSVFTPGIKPSLVVQTQQASGVVANVASGSVATLTKSTSSPTAQPNLITKAIALPRGPVFQAIKPTASGINLFAKALVTNSKLVVAN